MNIYTGQLISFNLLTVNQLCVKLVKFTAIRYFINETTFRSIYFAIFNSHLSYVCTACGQSIVPSHRTFILQRNALRIICFAKFNDQTTQLFRKIKIIKFLIWYQLKTTSS